MFEDRVPAGAIRFTELEYARLLNECPEYRNLQLVLCDLFLEETVTTRHFFFFKSVKLKRDPHFYVLANCLFMDRTQQDFYIHLMSRDSYKETLVKLQTFRSEI